MNGLQCGSSSEDNDGPLRPPLCEWAQAEEATGPLSTHPPEGFPLPISPTSSSGHRCGLFVRKGGFTILHIYIFQWLLTLKQKT